MYKKIEKPKISYLPEKALVLSISPLVLLRKKLNILGLIENT